MIIGKPTRSRAQLRRIRSSDRTVVSAGAVEWGLDGPGCPAAFLFLIPRNCSAAGHARQSELCLTDDNSSTFFPEYSPFLRLWAVASSLLPTQETKNAAGTSLDLAALLSCTGCIRRERCILSRQVRPAAATVERHLNPAGRALDKYALGAGCFSVLRVRVRVRVWRQGRWAPRAALALPAVVKALAMLLCRRVGFCRSRGCKRLSCSSLIRIG